MLSKTSAGAALLRAQNVSWPSPQAIDLTEDALSQLIQLLKDEQSTTQTVRAVQTAKLLSSLSMTSRALRTKFEAQLREIVALSKASSDEVCLKLLCWCIYSF